MSNWKRSFCSGCGAIGYVNDPSLDEINKIYLTASGNPKHSNEFAFGSTTEKIAKSLLLTSNWHPTEDFCLDYGSGGGSFSKVLLEMGAKVVVFEPFGENPKVPGLEWYRFWDEVKPNVSFGWVFLVEVVEHLLNPVEELINIRKRLLPGGKLLITTPNSKGWRAKFDGIKWREVQNPTHINLFSEKALRICLKMAGFNDVCRILRPVNYNAEGISRLMLSATQVLGIDGGLRMIAKVDS